MQLAPSTVLGPAQMNGQRAVQLVAERLGSKGSLSPLLSHTKVVGSMGLIAQIQAATQEPISL